MPRNANKALKRKHATRRHHAPSNPLSHRLLSDTKLSRNLRLAASPIDRISELRILGSVHDPNHYRKFLFVQQANPVGSITGTTCSFNGVSKDGKKDSEKVRIGRLIAAARKKARLTQVELALKLGIKQQSVGEWERGDTFPRGTRLHNLLLALPTLRSEFPHIATAAHHFVLTVRDYAILAPIEQQQVDDLVAMIEKILDHAARPSSLRRRPALKS